ncbi:MAG: hypothetical protein AAGI66_04205 [Cyanobacteria bacterium P01_H01_bin.74]
MDTIKLKVVAVTSSEEIRSALYAQLQVIDFVDFSGVCIELSDAANACQKSSPDILIVDTTHREVDAGLFIQTIGMDPESHCIIFALNRAMDIEVFKTVIKQGASEFIQYPDDQEALGLALRKHFNALNKVNRIQLESTVSFTEEKPLGELIVCFSSKGGAGCSTVAANLTYALNQIETVSAAFLDMDQNFCNSTNLFNVKPTVSMGDIADSNPNDLDPDFLNQLITKQENGVAVVVGSKSILDDNAMVSPELLEHIINHLLREHTYLVIDLPTHVLDPYHQYLVERADTLLLIARPDLPSLYHTRQYMDLAEKYLDTQKIKLLMNRSDLKSGYNISNKALEDTFAYDVYMHLPNDWDLAVEANSLGKLLTEIQPKSDLGKQFVKLARDLAERHLPQEENQPALRQKNPLSRLLPFVFK